MFDDHSKATEQTETTCPPAKSAGDHGSGKLRTVARYGTLGGMPAAHLAAQSTNTHHVNTSMPSPVHVLKNVAEAFGGLFAAHPLPSTVLVLGGATAGYMKIRSDWGLNTDEKYPRGDGFADKRQIKKVMGARSLVNKRKVLRPSLADVPARHVPVTEVGVPLGVDRKTGVKVYSSIEDSTVLITPMGGGKTALLAGMLLDAPGPVVTTSSKPDIHTLTAGMRGRTGQNWVFNPQQLSGLPTNLHWDPVVGCADPATALRRARYLLEGSDATAGVENRSFWQSASFKVLKSFLWAADVAGLTLLDVARWSKKPHDTPAREVFEKHADIAPLGWQDDLEQTQEVKGKATTLENVFGTLSMTFMFLALPEIAETIEAAHRPGGTPFDVTDFLKSGSDTAYLLGRDDGVGGLGPLFSALTGEIYEAARVLASYQKGERNDPPVTYVLDECAVICPVPLHMWTADSRGLGMTVHAAFQSRGQIEERWGRHGAETIWDNCTALILGGLKGDAHLKSLSDLCGTRKVLTETHSSSSGGEGRASSSKSSTTRDELVMTPADIKDLQPGEILILRKHVRALVVRFTPVWDRRDYKAWQKSVEQAEKAGARKNAAAQPGNPWAGTAAGGVERPPAARVVDGWADGGFARPHLQVVRPAPVESAAAVPPPRPGYDPTVHMVQPDPAPPVAEDDAQDMGAF